jgi:hypothetical protein
MARLDAQANKSPIINVPLSTLLLLKRVVVFFEKKIATNLLVGL